MAKPWVENCSEAAMKRLAPPADTVLVSITEHGCDVEVPAGYVNVLPMRFNDMDSERGYPRNVPRQSAEDRATVDRYVREMIQAPQASEIAVFVTRHRGKNILVHCQAGISRSRAVVEAILTAFPEYEDTTPPASRFPNGRVKLMVKRALGIVPIGAEEQS